MQTVTATKDISQTALAERRRLFAFWAAVIGLWLSAIVYASIYLSGDLILHYKITSPMYATFLGIMLVSAYLNRHVRIFTNFSIASIFAVFWVSSYAEAVQDHLTFVSTPLVLFVPILLMMVLHHKLVFALALAQFGLVLHYSVQFGTPHYAGNWSQPDQFSLSVALAVLSGLTSVAVGIVSRQRERTDKTLQAVVQEQSQLAATDALTGLLNRRAFMELTERRWSAGTPMAIGFIDLDSFKPLNDELGHAAGDAALCQIAERLTQYPDVYAAARLGGDEFAFLMDGELDELPSSVEALHAAITRPMSWQGVQMIVGASIGYALAFEDASEFAMVLRAADTAMRRSKRSIIKVARFAPSLDNAYMISSKLELELPGAIKNGQIRAAVQPIYSAKNDQLLGYELLARWVDSDFLNDPSPNAFIPAAEKLGVLNDILWATLREALSRLDLSGTSLSINISPAQLQSQCFLTTLLDVLAEYRVHRRQIVLEITEQVAIRNSERNLEVLNQARELGFEISLDDFGTGNSSLSTLAQLPITKLKIDRSFVSEDDQDGRSAQILRSAIRMAQDLGVVSSIEGIETDAQLQRMIALGADEVQGYYLGKPYVLGTKSSNPDFSKQEIIAGGGKLA